MSIFDTLSLLLILGLPILLIAIPIRWYRQKKRFRSLEQRITALEQHFRTDKAPEELPEQLAPAPSAIEVDLSGLEEAPPEPTPDVYAETREPETLLAEPETAPEPLSAPEIEAATIQLTEAAPAAYSGWGPSPHKRAGPERAKKRTISWLRQAVKPLVERGPEEDLESLIGGSWLNVIGIIFLVIGFALLLGYSLRYFGYFGPLGRVITGLCVGSALLLGGVFFEHRARYAWFGKSLIGGGWALLYFTGYAAHNVEAARVIENPIWGMSVLILVASGVIFHSLRYRSELVTSLAYGLGFIAVAISPPTPYSMLATGLLAASLIVVLRTMPWYHLGLVGVAGTYLTYFLWIEKVAGAVVSIGSFWLSLSILAFYWLLFIMLAVIKKPASARQHAVALGVNLANSAGFLFLAITQVRSVYPDQLYVFAAAAAVAYTAVAYLLRSLRHLYLLNAFIAIILAATTIPLAVNALDWPIEWLAFGWVLEAIALFALGTRLPERPFRLASYLLSVPVALSLFRYNLVGTPDERWLVLWLTVPPVIVFFIYMSYKLEKGAEREGTLELEFPIGVLFGLAAVGALGAFVWQQAPAHYVALLWLVAGIVLLEVGLRLTRMIMRMQGYLLAAAGAVGLFVINLYDPLNLMQASIPANWLIVGAAVAVLYILTYKLEKDAEREGALELEFPIGVLFGLSAVGALMTFIWQQAPAHYDGLLWLVSGIMLLEAGLRLSKKIMRMQSYLLAAAGAAGLFIINLYDLPGLMEAAAPSNWLIVGAAVAVLYMLAWRLRVAAHSLTLPEITPITVDFPAHAATALLAVLLWAELDSITLVLAWGFLGLVLYELGRRWVLPAIGLQGHVLEAATFVRLFLANFAAFGHAFWVSHRMLSTLPIAAIFYYLRWSTEPSIVSTSTKSRYHQLSPVYSYGAAIILVVLARFEFGYAHTVLAWAPLLLIWLVIGIRLHDLHLRLQAYILGILVFARSAVTAPALVGSFHGVPERYLILLTGIAALFAAALYLSASKRSDGLPVKSTSRISIAYLDRQAHILFEVLAAVLLTILLYHEVSTDWLTMAWAIQALVMFGIGFTLTERSFRIYGLVLLLVCLIKLVIIDLAGVETLLRIISYIVLGAVLLLVSYGYTRFPDLRKRYL